MYVGRIITVGMSNGKPFIGYRVSSRSFPNRIAKIIGDKVQIWPLDEEDMKRNPYIAYNCYRKSDKNIVLSNGSHTDPIFEELEKGTETKEAIRKVLVEMGYEQDSLNTPRIVGVLANGKGYLGVVRDNGCDVEEFELTDNKCRIISTYEMCYPTDEEFDIDVKTPQKAAEFVIRGGKFADLDLPVCSCVYFDGIAICNPHVK
ncbi:MAG: IMP cyclohydrolase [Abditibacteriota bacterium]|nr:IMP cyclohydrolase [Abditibacteriota bacterium]